MPAKNYDVNATIKELKSALVAVKSKLATGVSIALWVIFVVNLVAFSTLQLSTNQLQKMLGINLDTKQVIDTLGRGKDGILTQLTHYVAPDPLMKENVFTNIEKTHVYVDQMIRSVSSEESHQRALELQNLIKSYAKDIDFFFNEVEVLFNQRKKDQEGDNELLAKARKPLFRSFKTLSSAIEYFLAEELIVQEVLKKKVDLQIRITVALGLLSVMMVTGMAMYRLRNYSKKITQPVVDSIHVIEMAQDKAEKDMSLAANIQQALFSKQLPKLKDWDIALFNQSPLPISGDMWDIYHENGNLSGLWLFDVTGHGASAGLITMLAKTIFERNLNASPHKTLNESANKINKGLIKELNGTGQYLTGILLKVKGSKIEYINAGHPNLIMRRQGASSLEVQPEKDGDQAYKGMMFGVEGSLQTYTPIKIHARSNDLFVLYTDGFTECRNNEGEEFKEERILNFLNTVDHASSAKKILSGLLSQQRAFIGNHEDGLFDDASVIIFKKKSS